MKLKYNKQKGLRIKYKFMGFQTYSDLWYNDTLSRWENPEWGKYSYSNTEPCRSVKAFRRKLKKCPKGVEFVLGSRYVGYDVTGHGNVC